MVERSQETLFSIEELLVEGTPRNTGASHNTSDRRMTDTMLRGHIDHGSNDTSTLDLKESLVPVHEPLAPRQRPSARTMTGRLTSAYKSYTHTTGSTPIERHHR